MADGTRFLGDAVWGRKAARLPAQGTLLVATDLQGNLRDYERMKALFEAERRGRGDVILAFVGDLVHGPNEELLAPGQWPPWLGTAYRDESATLLLDFERLSREAPVMSLLGNHEHAHVGGPKVAKFHADEGAVLEASLGAEVGRMRAFLATFPLLAVAPCGLVLTHAAPYATEPSLDAFEDLRYDGYQRVSINALYAIDTVGALLWARFASDPRARALLRAVYGRPDGVVVYGHDVVHQGYERVSETQVCLSTSFGLHDADKHYLRVDLARPLTTASDLRDGVELLKLYDAV